MTGLKKGPGTGRGVRRVRHRKPIRRSAPAGVVEHIAKIDALVGGEAGAGARERDIELATARLALASERASPDILLAVARETYAIRRRRSRYLPADLFGEPTWDILLDLYVATREKRPVPTTSACIGAHVPPTTALRWLRILEARGLVEREEDGHDGRRTFVRLSERGLAKMDSWLQDLLVSFDHTVGVILRHGGGIERPMAEAAE